LVTAASRGLVPASKVAELLPDKWGDVDSFGKLWTATNREMADLLEQVNTSLEQGALSPPTATLERLGCADRDFNGAGTVTAAGAIYLAARFAARPEGGLLAAAFLRGGDTDTLASMTGAVLGSVQGADWMGDLTGRVQDSNYIAAVATHASERKIVTRPAPSKPVGRAVRDVRTLLTAGNISAIREFPDGRTAKVKSLEPLDGGMRRANLLLSDGQLVFVDVENTTTPRPALGADAYLPKNECPIPDTALDEERRMTATKSIRPPAGGIQVVLPSVHLSRCASFYAQLIGADLTIRDRTVRIAPWLVLREAQDNGGQDATEIMLTSPDLNSAIKRLNVNPASQAGDTIVLRDPDGRTVRVSKATKD
jgi:ADP-ribosylglycohydrolase